MFTIFNSTVSNEMYWNYELDVAWASLLDSDFKSKLKGWTYLCVIREILAIIAWIIICSQGYWNVGTAYKHKIIMLKRTGVVQPRFVAEEVYRHLFFGNPYLPNGVFTLAEDEPVAETKKAS